MFSVLKKDLQSQKKCDTYICGRVFVVQLRETYLVDKKTLSCCLWDFNILYREVHFFHSLLFTHMRRSRFCFVFMDFEYVNKKDEVRVSEVNWWWFMKIPTYKRLSNIQNRTNLNFFIKFSISVLTRTPNVLLIWFYVSLMSQTSPTIAYLKWNKNKKLFNIV